MNIEKATVKKILENAVKIGGWSLQGFGMLRLYLSPELRLHVWDSRYRVPNVSVIHDHPWTFLSVVIAGAIVQNRYVIVDSREGARPYTKQLITCGPGGGISGEPEDVWVRRERTEVIDEGQSYKQEASELHASRPLDGAVSIIERFFEPDTEHATVLFPRGQQWVSAEPRPATDVEVEDITGRALQLWFQ